MAYVQSILNAGATGIVIEIECQLSNGLPAIVIVGLGNKAVDEAKERVRSAFASTGLILPKRRITINLAPADVPKDSTSFDLPIAAAILQASGQHPPCKPDQAFIGEIGLDGSIRSVRGIIGKILAGRQFGITTYFVPQANLQQALLVPGIDIIPLTSVRELYCATNQTPSYSIHKSQPTIPQDSAQEASTLLDDVAGQDNAKRALEIAAAGGHNLLLYGPPGTGKSMLAKAFASLLPPPSHNEILEITHLHSLASQNYDALMTTRPFRSPHNNSSYAAMLGGGVSSKPGEVSLSHRGVLFMDELPEFNRTILEALRQPLENKCITISRSRRSIDYPANFILIATANPCPCGYYGTSTPCSCSPGRIVQYQQRLSGPIIDRIDLHVAVGSVEHRHILASSPQLAPLQQLRKRIVQARTVQHARYASAEKTNSDMTNTDIKRSAKLHPEASLLLNTAAGRLGISARGYVKTIKVARTIADLEQSQVIETSHITEALQYRPAAPKP